MLGNTIATGNVGKKRKSVNYDLCIVCQENSKEKNIAKKPKLSSLNRLIDACMERNQNGDLKTLELFDRLKDTTAEKLLEKQSTYNFDCYKDITNVKTIGQIKKRFNEAKEKNSPSVINRTPGRPSQIPTTSQTTPISTRSSGTYDKKHCIICQTPGGVLHKVEFLATGKRMLEIATKLSDKNFFLRLNTIPIAADAVANDVLYHLTCWTKAQRDAVPRHNKQSTSEFDQIVCDIEIINLIRKSIANESGRVIDMNAINKKYIELLQECETNHDNVRTNYKKYLKQLIIDNIPEVDIIKSVRKNEPERIYANETTQSALEQAINCNQTEELNNIFNVSQIIRKNLLTLDKWQFKGSFDNFDEPQYLNLMLKWILVGPKRHLTTEVRDQAVNKNVSVISQLILQSIKTDRQVSFIPDTVSNRPAYTTFETPFSVGLGLYIYNLTRSSTIINTLSAKFIYFV